MRLFKNYVCFYLKRRVGPDSKSLKSGFETKDTDPYLKKNFGPEHWRAVYLLIAHGKCPEQFVPMLYVNLDHSMS
jgi:hypothetical protein